MADPTYSIVIHDQTHPNKPPTRFEISLSIDATVKDLCEVITQKTGQTRDSFVIEDLKKKKEISTESEDQLKVSVAEFFDHTKKEKNILSLKRSESCKNVYPDTKENYGSHETTEFQPSSPPKNEDTRKQSHTTSQQIFYNTTSYSNSNFYNYNTKSDTGFCGLSNQGATCYLNSLLQTLFMTPEFRSALYNWSFEDYCQRTFEKKLEALQSKLEADPKVEGEIPDYDYEDYKKKTEDSLIPRQLQKLFLRLNTSDKRAVETKNLTKSFGWKSDEGFTQHDVQELCRVLFDALDTVWKGTDQANLINQFYQGEMQDYVQCLSCGNGSSRKDNFLDIPLVIKGFGATKAVGSIQEALEKFIEPETLTGDNQYHCDTCAKKSDARKGLKFNRFPYLLSLQLKRFDYDFNSHRRIKLNDRVTFPEILDMNPFLTSGNKGLTLSRRRQMEIQKKKDDGDADMEHDYDPEGANSSKEADDDDTEQTETTPAEQAKRKRQQTIALALKNGPYVYELFSVLVHRGSALGGHYYAYIRSFNTCKWYEFNDSTVKEIDSSTLKDAFGEDEKKYQYSYYSGSGANAYMLMYRQYDPEQNQVEHTKDTIPESIKMLIEEEARLEEEREQERIRQRDMVAFKFYYKDQFFEKKFMNTETMETVKNEAAKLFQLEHLLPDNFLLRDYNPHQFIPKEPFSDEQLKKNLSTLPYYYQTKPLLVETKKPQEQFRKYNPADLVYRIVYYNSDTKSWSLPEFAWVSSNAKLKDLKELLVAKYGIPVEEQEIVKEEYSKPKVLKNLNLELKREIYDGTKLYLERKSDDPDKEPLSFQEIDRVRNTIDILFSDPDEKECKHKLTLDKRMTLLELKEIIEKTIKLSIDEFKVFRVIMDHTRSELRNEDDKLSDCNLMNGSKIAVEKGKPLRRGELPCKFYLYDLEKETKEELFQAALAGSLTIKEIKEEIVRRWKEIQASDPKRANINLPNDPERFRLRDFFGTSKPYTVYMDHKTLKESVQAHKYFTSTNEIHIQILPEGKKETKTSEDTVVIILHQFHPDKYELSTPWEFDVHKDEKLGNFRDRISSITGISSISLAPAELYDIQNIIQIPSLKWHPDPDEDSKYSFSYYSHDRYDPSRLVRSLNFADGDMLLYRDLSIPIKKLTFEEERKIKDEEEKKRQIRHRAIASAYYSSRKEERLDIKIADVQLSQLSPAIIKKT